MVIYILKSTACLAIFFLFYKLFLEKENMHVFKRFYLLASLIAALSIPLLTFTSYVFVAPVEEFSPLAANETFIGILVEENKTDYLAITLWTIYGLGVLLFGLKFSYNLWKIRDRIHTNTIYKTQSFINVLLENLVTPHTFFNYIFLNKYQFETKKIPSEVLVHEQAHARQKHTLDILFIELLQIVFWFNPFIYLIKHAIKLNHEFLADEAVIKQGFNAANYQKTLLRYTSNDRQISLANAINYSFIKKRFTIMKTHTSKKSSWFRSILLLPLLTILIYGFSEKISIEKSTSHAQEIKQNDNAMQAQVKNELEKINSHIVNYFEDPIEKDVYYKNVTFILRNGNDKKVHATKKYQELSEKLRSGINPPLVPSKNTPTKRELNEWMDAKKYGIWIDKERVDNNYLNTINPKMIHLFLVSKLTKNAKNYGKHFYEVDLISAQVYNKRYKGGLKPLKKGTEIIIEENNYITRQDKATPDQIAEYNKIAKYYNALSKEKMVVKLKDIKRIKYIYGLMTTKQKKDAQAYPNFPPPPPPPPSLLKNKKDTLKKSKEQKTGWVTNDKEKLYYIEKKGEITYYNRFGKRVFPGKFTSGKSSGEEFNITILDDSFDNKEPGKIPPPPAANSKRVYKGQESDIPPPPPGPPNPLDHIIDMAKKGATFYYEGKKISSDKAIAIVKKNRSINVEIIDHDSKKPTVRLSKKPIVVKGRKLVQGKPISYDGFILEMSNKGAVFYFEGKKIAYEKAIEIKKKYKKITMLTQDVDTKEPLVFLSRKEITKKDIENIDR